MVAPSWCRRSAMPTTTTLIDLIQAIFRQTLFFLRVMNAALNLFEPSSLAFAQDVTVVPERNSQLYLLYVLRNCTVLPALSSGAPRPK